MTTPSSSPLVQVIVIDDDIIFRTGLCAWLSTRGVAVLSEGADLPAAGLQPGAQAGPRVDVILCGLNGSPTAVRPLMNALQTLTTAPILGLGPTDTALALRAQQAGAKGYWVKGQKPQTLLSAVQQVAAGAEAWSIPYWRSDPAADSGALSRWRRRLYISGLSQIESAIADLDAQLSVDLPPLDRAVTAGRRRELRAARGLVTWMLAPRMGLGEPAEGPAGGAMAPEASAGSPRMASDSGSPGRGSAVRAAAPTGSTAPAGATGAVALGIAPPDALIPSGAEPSRREPGAIVPGGVQVTLFETLDTKLRSPLRNQTRRPLELDILREDRRRELLHQVLRSLQTLLTELRQVSGPALILEQRSRLLTELWQSVVTEFFGKYYMVSVDGLELEAVPLLLREVEQVLPTLKGIVGVNELLAHLLFQIPLTVDGVPHRVGTATAMARAEQLLDNLVVRMANAVVQPMLNQFADIEAIKQDFYARHLVSSRDVAQFRNDLSWHYRLTDALYEPLDIFESQIRLLRLGAIGIEEQILYPPSGDEEDKDRVFGFGVPLLRGVLDRVAPRLQRLVGA
ncbi:MAG: DUF3685 domain-containing protein, partial [Elainellaceae cyanobacterium]